MRTRVCVCVCVLHGKEEKLI